MTWNFSLSSSTKTSTKSDLDFQEYLPRYSFSGLGDVCRTLEDSSSAFCSEYRREALSKASLVNSAKSWPPQPPRSLSNIIIVMKSELSQVGLLLTRTTTAMHVSGSKITVERDPATELECAKKTWVLCLFRWEVHYAANHCLAIARQDILGGSLWPSQERTRCSFLFSVVPWVCDLWKWFLFVWRWGSQVVSINFFLDSA